MFDADGLIGRVASADNASMTDALAPKQSGPFQFRLRTLLAAVTVFCVIAGLLAGFVYRGVCRSLDAEMTLLAYMSTLDSLTKFVQSNGKWPKDWGELIADDRGQTGRLSNWSDGFADLQSRVKVRFDLDLATIAAMTPDTFSAVIQREPNYITYPDDCRNLLDAVREGGPSPKPH